MLYSTINVQHIGHAVQKRARNRSKACKITQQKQQHGRYTVLHNGHRQQWRIQAGRSVRTNPSPPHTSHHCIELASIMLSWQNIFSLSFKERHCSIINTRSSVFFWGGGTKSPYFFLVFCPWTPLRDFRPHRPCNESPFPNPAPASAAGQRY